MKKRKLNKFKYKFYVPLFIFPIITVINNFLLYSSNFDIRIDDSKDDLFMSLTFMLEIISVAACCYMFIYYQELLERENKIKE